MIQQVFDDAAIAKPLLEPFPRFWDGKECVLALKDADYQWRQMEWIGWYFEWKCRGYLAECFSIPGDRLGNVEFDSKRSINWDFKAKAIKSDSHDAILNDCEAIDAAISGDGAYGVIMALLDVEYNDENRSFQQWHTELKGGLSKYEIERKARTSVTRFRKTSAVLQEILFLAFDVSDAPAISIHRQGRNSDGSPRRPKYAVNLERLGNEIVDRVLF